MGVICLRPEPPDRPDPVTWAAGASARARAQAGGGGGRPGRVGCRTQVDVLAGLEVFAGAAEELLQGARQRVVGAAALTRRHSAEVAQQQPHLRRGRGVCEGGSE
jgi:hypothetical protein